MRQAKARWRWALAALLVLAAIVGGFVWREQRYVTVRNWFLALSPFEIMNHPELVKFAIDEAPPLYAAHCATCHGADMQGNTAIGAPNLKDNVWMYGDNSVNQIERTILFGIRDGQNRTRDVTEMPAFGQRGLLSENQIQDIVQYILKLNGRPYDVEAAAEGPAIYNSGVASCFDCHGSDARGSSDYGAPDLAANVWNWGGSPANLYQSIFYGRHGAMPGWLGTLNLEQIRALAVYIHVRSTDKGKEQ